MERVKGETINDRNDRAIREGSRWYDDHLAAPKKSRIRTVLLTDDAGNREKAIASGLLACSGQCFSYVLVFKYVFIYNAINSIRQSATM